MHVAPCCYHIGIIFGGLISNRIGSEISKLVLVMDDTKIFNSIRY